MKLKNKDIIIKLIVLVAFLTISVCLYFMFRKNIIPETKNILIPILYILLVISGFALFIFSVSSTNQKEIEEEIEEETIEEIIEEDEEKKQEKEEKIDTEKLSARILPKTNEEKDLEKYTEKLLINFAKEFEFVQGIFFIKDKKKNEFNYCSDYAYYSEEKPSGFVFGETLPGQVAKNKKLIYLSDIPNDYIKILSGLGESSPNFLLISPILHKNNVIGIIEFASFIEIKPLIIEAIEEITNKIGEHLTKLI